MTTKTITLDWTEPLAADRFDEESLIFGYTWEQIKAAQQGAPLAADRKVISQELTANDMALFVKLGEYRLHEMGYHGTLDRLRRAGLIK
jgi:hypothetical protein